ncbi:lipopolysaccharide biosynthesis protein [Arenibacter lacus]|uniref:lipopolysaccharide biosynthesis protein n=1 Tax=Arenibacter lacus TaxID=2608629 RepID=UPI00123E2EB4|nr:oligosaccharide flippase family protein [Arenibacter lacus]
MSANKTIVKNSLVLYIRLIIVSIIGLLSSRFILQALGASDFGLYSVVGGIVFMMAFLNNVMVSTTYRYVAFEMGKNDPNGVNKVFNISLLIHLFIALLTVLLAETFGAYYIHNYLNVPIEKIEDAIFVFRFSVISTAISIISVPFQGLLVAKEKFTFTAFIEVLRSILAFSVVILILNYDGDRLRLYAALIALVSIIISILYVLYSRYYYYKFVKWKFQKDVSKYKEMISFSGWIMFGSSASAAEIQLSAIIINIFFSTVVNAAFGISNQVKNMVIMFSKSLNQAVIPQITKSFSSGDTGRTMQLVIFSSKFSFFMILIPAFPILLETEYILGLWLENVPEYTSIFVQIIIVNALIATMDAGIPAAVHATGNIKYFQIILSTITLLALPVSYLLFSNGYEPYFMTLTFTATAVINLIVRQLLLKRILHFNIKKFIWTGYFKMLLVLIPLLTLFSIKYFINEGFVRFIGLSSLSTLMLFILVYFLGMENSERNLVRNQMLNSTIYKRFSTLSNKS